jgi:hypothetical protein
VSENAPWGQVRPARYWSTTPNDEAVVLSDTSQ